MGYTDQQRQQALDLYVQHGAAEAARRCGADKRSIRRWAADAGLSAARDDRLTDGGKRLALQHAFMREELRVRLLEKAIDVIERMDEPHLEYKVAGNSIHEVTVPIATSGDVKNYASALHTFIGDYRLEMGEHTTHAKNEGSDDIDRSVAQLVDEIGRRNQTAVPPAAVD